MSGSAAPRRGIALGAGVAAVLLCVLMLLPAGAGAGAIPRDSARAPPSVPTAHPLPLAAPSPGSARTAAATLGGTAWLNATAGTPAALIGRNRAGMAYDAQDGYLVLFGGYNPPNPSQFFNDTWSYRAGHWSQLFPTTSPSARANFQLAYDPVDRYVVLFGGFSFASGMLGDTWTFAGGAWTQLSPTLAPSARDMANLAWDPVDQCLVLFGGEDGAQAFNDTWTFVHGVWSQIHPAVAPQARYYAAFAADALDGELVLFGGATYSTPANLGDTWTYAHGAWSRVTPGGTTPPAGALDAMAPDVLGSVLLYNGWNGTGPAATANNTWTFQNGSWTRVSPAERAPNRAGPSLAFDPEVGNDILFGGNVNGVWTNTTFRFDSPVASQVPNATRGEAPFNESFRSNVSGGLAPYSYAWSYGDGNRSNGTVADPVHDYRAPGLDTATLVVTDAANATSVPATSQVSIAAHLAARIQLSAAFDNGTVPWNVTVSASVSGGVAPFTYAWSFGDGASSTSGSASHVYRTAGSFEVNLTVTDALGVDAVDHLGLNATAPPSNGGGNGGGGGGSVTGSPISPLEIAGIVAVLAAVAAVAAVLVWRSRRSGGAAAPPEKPRPPAS